MEKERISNAYALEKYRQARSQCSNGWLRIELHFLCQGRMLAWNLGFKGVINNALKYACNNYLLSINSNKTIAVLLGINKCNSLCVALSFLTEQRFQKMSLTSSSSYFSCMKSWQCLILTQSVSVSGVLVLSCRHIVDLCGEWRGPILSLARSWLPALLIEQQLCGKK